MAIPTVEQRRTINGLVGMHGPYDEVVSEKTEHPAEARVQFVIYWGHGAIARKFFAVGTDGHRSEFDNFA
jgi:hypothetical protein